MAKDLKLASPCLSCGSINVSIWAQATDLEYFSTKRIYRYFSCENCGCVFIDPVPRELMSVIYPENYYSYIEQGDSFIQRVKNRLDGIRIKNHLKKVRKKQISVLDIGGGTGWMLDIVKNVDKRVDHCQIIDINPKAKIQATNKGYHYFCGTVEKFVTQRKYDFILCLNLIEHVDSPLEFLNKLSNLLNEGGVVLLKTPNINSLDATLFRNGNWCGLHCPRHWVIFSKKSWAHLVKRTNLKTDSLQLTQGAPFWAGSFLMLLHRLGWIQASAQKPIAYHPLNACFIGLFAFFDLLRSPFSSTSQMFVVLKHA